MSHLFIIYHCNFLFILFSISYTRMTLNILCISCILWHKAQDLTWVIWMKVGASWAPVACARSAREDCATDQDFYLNFSIVSVEMSALVGQGCGTWAQVRGGETLLQHGLRSVSALMWVVASTVCIVYSALAGSRFPGSTLLLGQAGPGGQWVPLQETSAHTPPLAQPWVSWLLMR